MSFYTNNIPRLTESHIVNKLLYLNKPPKKKPFINYNKINNCFGGFWSRNWSFIIIIGILTLLLYYRYRINKGSNDMKKARQNYMNKIIMDNYLQELEYQKLKDQDTINEPTDLLTTNGNKVDQLTPDKNIKDHENDLIVQETMLETPPNEKLDEPVTFEKLFSQNLDFSLHGFEGNSQFAPF
jgi:hypothetical protein